MANGCLFLEVLLDEQNTNSFVSLINSQIMAVPFAYHSKTTDQKFSIGTLIDVDTNGIEIGDVLKWDGTNWVPEDDNMTSSSNGSDTVIYASVGNSSIYADTALFSNNCLVIQPLIVQYSLISQIPLILLCSLKQLSMPIQALMLTQQITPSTL